ncbi:alpha/beta fold hydrolase [Candidatus Woesearchaeota archaeon]|nr:alpha/beta fold hydrolase [Candidatus Woesearchaeota archaeon]
MNAMHGNPFFIKKGKKACLLIHGLTSSTQEIEELALFLSKKNFTVIAPLLKGHNTSIEDLNKTDWHNWFDSVIRAYKKIEKSKKIFVVGISIGAILALHLARHKKTNALVLLAPAVFYKDWRVRFINLAKYFIGAKKKNYKKYYPWREPAYYDIYNEEAIKQRVAYDEAGLNALSSALLLINHVKKELKKIYSPILIIHSKNDHTILPQSSSYIYNNIGSKEKKIIWLRNSGHVVSVDNEKEKVFQLVCNFLSKN